MGEIVVMETGVTATIALQISQNGKYMAYMGHQTI
jgi:hypothetical protein